MTIMTVFCAQASTTPSRSLIEFKHAIRTFSSRSARENWSRARTLKVSCRSEAHRISIFRDFRVEKLKNESKTKKTSEKTLKKQENESKNARSAMRPVFPHKTTHPGHFPPPYAPRLQTVPKNDIESKKWLNFLKISKYWYFASLQAATYL